MLSGSPCRAGPQASTSVLVCPMEPLTVPCSHISGDVLTKRLRRTLCDDLRRINPCMSLSLHTAAKPFDYDSRYRCGCCRKCGSCGGLGGCDPYGGTHSSNPSTACSCACSHYRVSCIVDCPMTLQRGGSVWISRQVKRGTLTAANVKALIESTFSDAQTYCTRVLKETVLIINHTVSCKRYVCTLQLPASLHVEATAASFQVLAQ